MALLRAYYDQLIKLNPRIGAAAATAVASTYAIEDNYGYTFDDCYRDYVRGGVSRMCYELPMVMKGLHNHNTSSGNGGGMKEVQYFVDQLTAFCEDHWAVLKNGGVEMPRV